MEYPAEYGSQLNLTDYLLVLRKRKKLAISVFLAIVLLVALYTFSAVPIYRSTAGLMIDVEKQHSPLTGEALENEPFLSQQLTFKTHFRMIKAKPVLESVLKKIDLSEEQMSGGPVAEYLKTVKASLSKLITSFTGGPGKGAVSGDDGIPDEKAERLEYLDEIIRIEEVRNTRLLNIHVEHKDPHIARDIANTLAEAYIVYDSDLRFQSSRRTMDWLTKQLYDMKKNVEDSEQAFQRFKERESLFSIEGKQKINVRKIDEMNAEYITARTKVMELEAKIQELNRFISQTRDYGKDIPHFLKNQFIENLYTELLEAEVEHKRMSGIYKERHPDMILVTSKIKELERKIQNELQKALSNAQSERKIILAREKALEEAMGRYEEEAIKTNRKELQYTILEREVSTNRELYNTLLSKVKESNILGEVTKSNLRIAEPAALAYRPVKPRKALNLALGIILGAFAGIVLVFMVEHLDKTIHNKAEVERYLNLSVLAEIPKEKTKKSTNNLESKLWPNLKGLPLFSHFAESFKILSTSLTFSEANKRRSVYLITSSEPGEGKTTIAYNLGLTLANRGLKVLAIDSDLRIPNLTRSLSLEEKKGLTDILVDTFATSVEQGKLGDLTIGDLHKLIEIQEKSGNLHYRGDQDRFTVSFVKGRVMDVEWTTRPSEQRLGSQLVQSGRVTQEQAKIALVKQKRTSRRLGQILVDLGFVTVEELAGPLRLQIQEGLQALRECKNASYMFLEDPPLMDHEISSQDEALFQAIGKIEPGTPLKTPFLLEQIKQRFFHSENKNLVVLGSGKRPPNPSELLASHRMKILIDMLRREFDVILLDSPPLGTVSDPLILSSISDGAILSVAAGGVRIGTVTLAKERLDSIQASIVGVVLNKLEAKHDPYRYGRHYGKYKSYYTDQVDVTPEIKPTLRQIEEWR